MKEVYVVIQMYKPHFGSAEDYQERVLSVHESQSSAINKYQELQLNQLHEQIEMLEKDAWYSPHLDYTYLVASKPFIED